MANDGHKQKNDKEAEEDLTDGIKIKQINMCGIM